MFGKSIYISDLKENPLVIEENVDLYFTSLHIAEEFSEDYAMQAAKMLDSLKAAGKKVMVDISSRGLENLGYTSLKQFVLETGVYMVRCDFGISEEEMLEAAKHCAIAVNASTLDYQLAVRLKQAGAEVFAVHNFYPRPETGLDEEFFVERNQDLREKGIKIAAFITGDIRKRGPLMEGLPTLEAHRDLPPYLQYLQMVDKYRIDMVLIGDPALSEEQMRLIERKKCDKVTVVPAVLDAEYESLYGKVWTIRQDSPKWIARLQESRGYAAIGQRILPGKCEERTAGSITIDNEKYLRYSGEIQVVRETLKADERVNVIGRVLPGYEAVLEQLNRGEKIEFVKERNK